MNTEFRHPDIGFNPVTVSTLKIIENSQVRLKPVKRYVHINQTDKIINLYVELTDGNVILTVPVKYYEWVAVSFSNTVLCDYIKFKDGDNTFSCVEIRELDKVNIQMSNESVNVFSDGGNEIPESYSERIEEKCLVKTMLNSYNKGLACGMGTGYIDNNKIYVRGICSIDNLLKRDVNYQMSYRKLVVNGEEYKVDIEVVELNKI